MRYGQRVSELVDFDDVWDVPVPRREPDDPARENQSDNEKPASGDLPVAFAENEIGVTLIPFTSGLDVKISAHGSTCTRKTLGIHRATVGFESTVKELAERSPTTGEISLRLTLLLRG